MPTELMRVVFAVSSVRITPNDAAPMAARVELPGAKRTFDIEYAPLFPEETVHVWPALMDLCTPSTVAARITFGLFGSMAIPVAMLCGQPLSSSVHAWPLLVVCQTPKYCDPKSCPPPTNHRPWSHRTTRAGVVGNPPLTLFHDCPPSGVKYTEPPPKAPPKVTITWAEFVGLIAISVHDTPPAPGGVTFVHVEPPLIDFKTFVV